MANIPNVIPTCTVSDYKITPDNPKLRTEMESGPARQRRIYTDAPTRIGCKWLLTNTEFSVFAAWHKYTLSDGTAWFTMPIANGDGVTDTECRFVGMYEASQQGRGIWAVTATIEVKSMPMMTESELEAYLD